MTKWQPARDTAIWIGTSAHLPTDPGWHTPGPFFCGYFETHNEALIAAYRKWLAHGETGDSKEGR